MTLVEKAKQWFAAVEAAPVERRVADLLPGGAIAEDRFPDRVKGDRFEPGMSYFGIRLSGLHLVDARRFATMRLPLCVCLVEFQNAGQRRTVPFSIGPDVIQQKLKAAGINGQEQKARSAWIELLDLTVVRPTPVSEDNVQLYAGLFSVPSDNLVKSLLNVVGSIGTALGQPQLGAGLKVAETIYDSFGAMLGSDGVDQVAAALIGNVLTERGSGYLLIANTSPDDFDLAKARVIRGRLHWPEGLQGGGAVVEFDHALLALEQFDTVIQKGTGLAPALFGSLWAAVGAAASRNEAAAALRRLQDGIATSPDLTENDRIALIGGYAKAAEALASARWGTTAQEEAATRAAVRGAAGDALTTRLRLAAQRFGPDDMSAPDRPVVVRSVNGIAKLLDDLPDMPPSKDAGVFADSIDALALEAATRIHADLMKRKKPLDSEDALSVRSLLVGAST